MMIACVPSPRKNDSTAVAASSPSTALPQLAPQHRDRADSMEREQN